MAKTQGHGNADWSRDETILALDLYLECEGGSMPDDRDARVVALSELLRSFPIHPAHKRVESFRNPAGVAFKLQNIRSVARSRGMPNGSETDRAIWSAFGNKRAEVAVLAQAIKDGFKAGEALPVEALEIGDEQEFAEGRLLTSMHFRRERNPKLRRAFIATRLKQGRLSCDGCGFDASSVDSTIAHAAFEAHHLAPLASLGESKTKVADLALLCATCHRLVHRWIAVTNEWPMLSQIELITGGRERLP